MQQRKSNINVPVSGLRAAATVDTATLNTDENTVEVVFASETPVRRRILNSDWEFETVNEVLECTQEAVDMERINNGAAVLDTHMAYSLEHQLGSTIRGWVQDGVCRCLIRLSTRPELKGIIDDIKNKVIRNVSVGYDVLQWVITETEGQMTEYRAKRWEPVEITFCPVQADRVAGLRLKANGGPPTADINPLAEVRSAFQLTNNNNNNPTTEMEKVYLKLRGNTASHIVRSKGVQLAPGQIVHIEKDADVEEGIRAGHIELATKEEFDAYIAGLVRAAAPQPQPGNNPNPAPAAGTDERSLAILRSVIRSGGTAADAVEFISSTDNLERVLERVIEKYAGGGGSPAATGAQNVQVGTEERQKVGLAMEGALAHRSGIVTTLPDNGARDFRGMDLIRMAEEVLRRMNINTLGMSRAEIAREALNIGNQVAYGRTHSTSDFPIILGNVVNRSLLAAYEQAERTFQPFTRRGTIKDFRPVTRARLSDLVKPFKKVSEGGEYQRGSFSDSGETYQLGKYGEIIAITWETLINDDLDAFSRIPTAIANESAQLQSDIVYDIIVKNLKMSDNKALFHADHGNLGTHAAIDVTSLGKGREAMGKQKTDGGKRKMNIKPSFLIVGPDQEQVALQYLSANFVAATSGNTNPWAGTMQPIVEGRIPDGEWYLAALPGIVDTIEYAFLEGEGELFTERRYGFEVDGLEIKARTVFAAKAIDYRGFYKNPAS